MNFKNQSDQLIEIRADYQYKLEHVSVEITKLHNIILEHQKVLNSLKNREQDILKLIDAINCILQDDPESIGNK